MKWLHDHGYGNAGATSGHLIPDHERVLKIGWKGIMADLESGYNQLSDGAKHGPKGAQLRAMMTAAIMPRDLAAQYSDACLNLAAEQTDPDRRQELLQMGQILVRVPLKP